MKTKTKALWLPILAAALAAAFTVSCAFEPKGEKEGSLSLRFALGRSTGSSEQARVWVYLSNVLIPNSAGGTDYYATNLTDGKGSVTIENLPPGEEYRIVVAVGTAQGSSLTDVSRYGTSTAFTVNSGISTNVSLDLKNMMVDRTLSGSDVKSVVVYDAGSAMISAATATAVFTGSEPSFSVASPSYSMPAGHTVNSLSVALVESGPDELLVNGTNGVTYDGTDAVGIWDGSAPSVLQSGGFIPNVGEPVYFFQANKEFGGLVGDPGTEDWVSIDLDLPGISGKPILDFFVSDGDVDGGSVFGFFATRLAGAFRIDSDFITEDDDDFDYLGAILNKDSRLRFFENEAAWGKSLPTVQAFGYAGDSTKVLYVGTKNGVYRTRASFGSAALSGSATLVPGTRGLDIVKIATNADGAAFMAASEVVVLRNGKVYRLPFLKDLVGSINDIAWNDQDLLVAGTRGLARIETSAAAFN